MVRTWMLSGGFVVLGLLAAGCDTANNAATRIKEDAKKEASQAKDLAKRAKEEVKEDVKEAADKARLAVIKPVEEELPKIEEKIEGLRGESATKAKEKFEQFKKLLQHFKLAAPDKWEALKDGLMKEFDELKKLVGLAK
jgi:DNA anti-recombination protein RmuC